MLNSVRARLAAWHTLVIAAILVLFTLATHTFLSGFVHRQVDQSLEDTGRAFVAAFRGELDPERRPEEAISAAVAEFRFRDRRVLVFDSAASLVAATRIRSASPSVARFEADFDLTEDIRELFPMTRGLRPRFRTFPAREGPLRSCVLLADVGDERYAVVVVTLATEGRAVLSTFLRWSLTAIPITLLLAAVGGYLLARRSMAPVLAMSRRAARIGEESLHERLPVINPNDELGQLASVFNRLLARLEEAFRHQRQFMADASHELRTPVTILRTEAEVALSKPDRDAGAFRESLGLVREEAVRLGTIVDDLLTMARADTGDLTVHRTGFYLEELLLDAANSVRSLAASREIVLTFEPALEAPFQGDESLVRRAVLNVLDNAIKYTPPGGRVDLQLARDEAGYVISVRDSGPGIPQADQARIFDRFYRARSAVTGNGEREGAGLGLAISRMLAEAHGGRLVLVRSNASGTEFALHLPAHH